MNASITKAVHDEILRRVQEIQEDEIAKAKSRVECRIREQTLNIAATVFQKMNITELDGQSLKIVVEFKP